MLTFTDIALLFLLALAICIALPILSSLTELTLLEFLLKRWKRK